MTAEPRMPPPEILPAFDDGSRRDWIVSVWLIAGPAVALMLFVGGVNWIKTHAGAATDRDAADAGIVQVHLLPRPDPAPISALPLPDTGSVRSTAPEPASDTRDAPASPPPDAGKEQLHAALPDPSEGTSQSTGVQTAPFAETPATIAAVAFREALRRHIAPYQRYPREAMHNALTGTVTTIIAMDRKGRVLEVRIKTSSGEPILDLAAIDTIRRAQPFPPVPRILPEPYRVELSLGFDPP